ncbi:DUF742 domain-containing protein [Actinocorallia sp. API 0066]|uniref:DUF742 domain-containing protein n=1 Tax=Actinocorallia sp. API 0066 TaxID=2896846 RepID=UPI001E39019F|nr:DUF742 domain-containing protein [Actinocorallia sp. API 0066]MCD0448535.1 DUF742 domain-containing protein [Actinocorallia sp. API 0066]
MNGWDDTGPRLPDPRMVEIREEPRRAVLPGSPTVAVPTDDALDEPGSIVRPFIVTGGRTRPVDERLRVEQLISAAPAALSAPLTFERRQIVRLCQRPVSVAEVAGRLGAPVGVVRVLIADLAAERLVTVHDPLGPHDLRSRELLERIRDGVRAL